LGARRKGKEGGTKSGGEVVVKKANVLKETKVTLERSEKPASGTLGQR